MDTCSIGLKRGDLVKVLDHNLKDYKWTVGHVGSILCQAHVRDFDLLHHRKKMTPPPPLKPGWWVVSVEHSKAKGGHAFAGLPEEYLAPHACTDRCPEHKCRAGTG